VDSSLIAKDLKENTIELEDDLIEEVNIILRFKSGARSKPMIYWVCKSLLK
jgi:hypothetical protein